eukprot:14668996-Ditylum_brightwellii.AAC.1
MGVTWKYDDANDNTVNGYQPSPPRTCGRRLAIDNTLIASPTDYQRSACHTNAKKKRLTPS